MLNVIFFAIWYSTITNFPRYGKMWYMNLLIFYSRFSLISLSSSPSATQYSPPPSPLSHTLSFSLFPFDLFSSHSWIWATTDFLSTITDLLHLFFFSPFCSLSPLCSISESPIGVGLCSILSHRFAAPCSQSRRFAVLSLKVSSIHRFLWRFHRFVLHLLRIGKFSVFSMIL